MRKDKGVFFKDVQGMSGDQRAASLDVILLLLITSEQLHRIIGNLSNREGNLKCSIIQDPTQQSETALGSRCKVPKSYRAYQTRFTHVLAEHTSSFSVPITCCQ